MKLLSITGLVIALSLPVPLIANTLSNELNLSDEQQQQLQQFKEKRKLERQQTRKKQQEADKIALSVFLSEEQIQLIMQKKTSKKRPARSLIKRLIQQKERLNLTENQIVQLQQIPEKIEPTADKKRQRQKIKQEITTILSAEQLEQMQALKRKKPTLD